MAQKGEQIVFVVDGKKPCSVCKKMLPVADFGKASHQQTGFKPRCKKCEKSLMVTHKPDWAKDKKCKVCGQVLPATCFAKHKRSADGLLGYCKICNRDFRLQREYDITLAEYDEMFENQDGVCAICGLPEITRRLSVDHCHKTGKVRELLCFSCNSTLGSVDDNLSTLLKMVAYLQKYKE